MTKKKKKIETSKEIVLFVLVVFSVSMAASYTLPILFEYAADVCLRIFQTTATLTGSVLIGYYGKAGFENYDKNKKLLGLDATKEEEIIELKDEGGVG